jgi:2-keto-3-deoxy-L-rhamnonate aldolase RhmA
VSLPDSRYSSSAAYEPRPGSILNAELLIVAMIESPQAAENADAIAAIPGIDVLLTGSNDLALEMGVRGQLGHDRIPEAFEKVGAPCRRHNKVLGIGGVYDQELASRYRPPARQPQNPVQSE